MDTLPEKIHFDPFEFRTNLFPYDRSDLNGFYLNNCLFDFNASDSHCDSSEFIGF